MLSPMKECLPVTQLKRCEVCKVPSLCLCCGCPSPRGCSTAPAPSRALGHGGSHVQEAGLAWASRSQACRLHGAVSYAPLPAHVDTRGGMQRPCCPPPETRPGAGVE